MSENPFSKRIFAVIPLIFTGVAIGCAPAGHLATPSGKPEVTVANANWKTASVAIAEYNFAKGRKLDIVKPDEIILYDAVASNDGTEQITSKTVYRFLAFNDTIVISSQRYFTEDLDDSEAVEANDQATYDAEEQDLAAIAQRIGTGTSQSIAEPAPIQ